MFFLDRQNIENLIIEETVHEFIPLLEGMSIGIPYNVVFVLQELRRRWPEMPLPSFSFGVDYGRDRYLRWILPVTSPPGRRMVLYQVPVENVQFDPNLSASLEGLLQKLRGETPNE